MPRLEEKRRSLKRAGHAKGQQTLVFKKKFKDANIDVEQPPGNIEEGSVAEEASSSSGSPIAVEEVDQEPVNPQNPPNPAESLITTSGM